VRPALQIPAWVPSAAGAVAVATLGSTEAVRNAEPYRYVDSYPSEIAKGLLLAFLCALAVGLHRVLPAVSLTVVVVACAYQVVTGTGMQLAQLGLVMVAFGAARWGSPATRWVSAALIPAAALSTVAVSARLSPLTRGVFDSVFGDVLQELVGSLTRRGAVVSLGLIGFGLLAVPWLIGLSLRLRADARVSRDARMHAEEERVAAVELAAVREEQAQLARDVHDVVGHSLAVILAQAESAQFLPDHDGERLKRTLATIATSARVSLVDVRQVLGAGHGAAVPSEASFDQLVEGVRASGAVVNVRELGQRVPLPPELAEVAHRVLQEMLTNALRHGVRDATIDVARTWDRELSIDVVNPVPAGASSTAPVGVGLSGMRRRLESVGGRLDTGLLDGPDGARCWRSVAHLPLRAPRVPL